MMINTSRNPRRIAPAPSARGPPYISFPVHPEVLTFPGCFPSFPWARPALWTQTRLFPSGAPEAAPPRGSTPSLFPYPLDHRRSPPPGLPVPRLPHTAPRQGKNTPLHLSCGSHGAGTLPPPRTHPGTQARGHPSSIPVPA